MRTFTSTSIETFHVISCYTCGVAFGIGSDLYRRVVTDANGSIYCPACGKESCWQESEASKRIKELQRKLEWEAKQSERLKAEKDSANASLIATKGIVTRLQKRVAAGVCQCCKRTFKQLSAHMANKHPEFVSQ